MKKLFSCLKKSPLLVLLLAAATILAFTLTACSDGVPIDDENDVIVDPIDPAGDDVIPDEVTPAEDEPVEVTPPDDNTPPEDNPADEETSAALTMCYCTNNYPGVVDSSLLNHIPPRLECDRSVTACTEKTRGALVVNWDVSNVKSAYVVMHTSEIQVFKDIRHIMIPFSYRYQSGKNYKLYFGKKRYTYPVGYMDFIGDPDMPHIGTKASSVPHLFTGALLDDPLQDFDLLGDAVVDLIDSDGIGAPFNYCELRGAISSCFDKHIEVSDMAGDIMNVFIPLLDDENSRSGAWLLKTKRDVGLSPIKLYYKEWASGKVRSKTFAVPDITRFSKKLFDIPALKKVANLLNK